MKPIVYTKYGPIAVLHLREVDKPTLDEGKVLANGINAPATQHALHQRSPPYSEGCD